MCCKVAESSCIGTCLKTKHVPSYDFPIFQSGMQPVLNPFASGASPARSITPIGDSQEIEDKSRDLLYTSSSAPPGDNNNVPCETHITQPIGYNADAASAPGGGGPFTYVSSSDSSSPLSETYRPANECRAKSASNSAASNAAAAIASNKHSSNKTCFKQVQFHLNNIALSAPLLKNKFGTNTSPCTATASTQARLLNQIPILRNVRKTRKKRKKMKGTESSLKYADQQKQILNTFPNSKAFLYACLNRPSAVPDTKDIVYNGTYPIDQPFCSRFKNGSFSLSSTDTELDGALGLRTASVLKPEPPITATDSMLRKRNISDSKYVKTFAIDEPI